MNVREKTLSVSPSVTDRVTRLNRVDSENTKPVDLVQGELFSMSVDSEETKGYRGTVASKVAGITYRQLDYWARKQIVVPSITRSHGSGSRRLYSFRDVLILSVSKKLLDTGVNLQNVTSTIGFLSLRSCAELEHLTVICDGQDVKECESGDQVLEFLDRGTAVFAVSVGKLWKQVEKELEKEPYFDVSFLSSSPLIARSSPIEDIAVARMRDKLEAQRVERSAQQ